MNIAIIDDSRPIQIIASKVIAEYYEKKPNYNLEDLTISTYNSALEYLNDSNLKENLLFVDIQMPKMDGTEMVEFLLLNRYNKDIPIPTIVFLSAQFKDDSVNALLEMYPDNLFYVMKPFGLDDLIPFLTPLDFTKIDLS
jgi:CheY-like chemotaxis protein